MTKEDIEYISNLLIRAGTKLADAFTGQRPETEMRDIMKKFKALNNSVGEVLKLGLASRFPEVSWSDDEFNLNKQHRPDLNASFWVADPLDGGVNFMQAFSPWGITLTRISKGYPVFAMIYNPADGELFYATENGGAFLNGKQIHVSEKTHLNFALMGTAFPNNMLKEAKQTVETLSSLQSLSKKVFAFRILGPASIQLAYMACGRIDGYVEYGNDIYDWLAGSLIVKEAGGQVSATDGTTFDFGKTGIIASNSILHQGMMEALTE
jgi:myo-inositol-1(or 4)-monophosphatase